MTIVFGLILIGLGVYFIFFQRTRSANDALEIQAQETKTIPEVVEALEAMADIDPNYREMVEVKGFAQCANPARTPYSQKEVAYYVAETVQVSETTEEYTDSDGDRRIRTNRHEDKLSEEESGEELLLRDNSGNEIVIETNGISNKLDLLKTLDRFERDDPYASGRYYQNPRRRYQQFSIRSYGTGYRILGYKQIEKAFPLNALLYALGEAYLNNGRVYLGPPRDPKKSFIVTTKSEEQLVQSKKNSQLISLGAGALSALIGIIMLISGIAG